MPRFFARKEETTIGRRGKREIVRVRQLHGNWIMREEFRVAEPLPGGRGKRWTHYRSRGEAERALELTSPGDLTRSEIDKDWFLRR
jgi:hypothetical protein